jgi:hypothetical protein
LKVVFVIIIYIHYTDVCMISPERQNAQVLGILKLPK